METANTNVSGVAAHFGGLKDLIRKCEEIIEEHKHRRPFRTGEDWGYDEHYRCVPVDQYRHLENTMSFIRECVNDLERELQGRTGMTVSGLIDLLENVQAQHGDLKVYCGDMEGVVVEVEETEDKEQYGDRFLYLGNGSVG